MKERAKVKGKSNGPRELTEWKRETKREGNLKERGTKKRKERKLWKDAAGVQVPWGGQVISPLVKRL